MTRRTRRSLLVVVAVVVAVGLWLASGRNAPAPNAAMREAAEREAGVPDAAEAVASEHSDAQLPYKVPGDGFASADSCRECHAEFYDSWHRTYHRKMTQAASPESILGDFDDVKLVSRGREYHLEREGDNFWVTMADPGVEEGLRAQGVDLRTVRGLPTVKRQIVMTTGSHNIQGYWIPDNFSTVIRQIPWYYLIEDQRWIPREDAFIQPPGSARHFAIWNDNCIVCHSVGGKPRVNVKERTVDTQVADFGVACEACHGPGEEHVAWHAAHRDAAKAPYDDPIVNPADCEPHVSAQICGQCHSDFVPPDDPLFLERGYTYRAGGDLTQSHVLSTYEEAHSSRGNDRIRSYYWDDRACRVGGREYLGLIESPCYQQGSLSCVSCHSMHHSDPNDQLAKKMDGSEACLQCHQDFRTAIEEHTHHAAASTGSDCYNCHMPHTSYALFKAIRSHRIDSPSAANEVRTGRPNACNLCHLDRTLKWTAGKLEEWYGMEPPELDADQETIAASVLTLLKGDAVQRIVGAWNMGWKPALEASGSTWQVRFLAELLNDDYPPIRNVAGRAIRNHPGMKDVEYDFVAPAEQRLRSRQAILGLWTANSAPEKLAPEAKPAGLFDAETGEVREQTIKRLVRQRDNRPVNFPE